jgi:hypothetical protein
MINGWTYPEARNPQRPRPTKASMTTPGTIKALKGNGFQESEIVEDIVHLLWRIAAPPFLHVFRIYTKNVFNVGVL